MLDDLAAGAPKEAEVRESDLEVDDGRILHTYDVGPTERDDELVLLWHHGTPNIGAPPEPLFPRLRRWVFVGLATTVPATAGRHRAQMRRSLARPMMPFEWRII